MTTDHFSRLGLARRFALDPEELERYYLARSRAVHPDFYAEGSTAELSASTDLSATLNDAYNTLKEPFARAEYLLALDGGPSAAEPKAMHAAFLAEMLELRERIEESRGNEEAIAALETEFAARYNALMDEVAGRFANYEDHEPDDAIRPELRDQIRNLLNAAKYVRGLLRDLQAD